MVTYTEEQEVAFLKFMEDKNYDRDTTIYVKFVFCSGYAARQIDIDPQKPTMLDWVSTPRYVPILPCKLAYVVDNIRIQVRDKWLEDVAMYS